MEDFYHVLDDKFVPKRRSKNSVETHCQILSAIGLFATMDFRARRFGPQGTRRKADDGNAAVFHEIMNAPDQGIPQGLLNSAKCIAIIPGDVKFAFVFGGSHGRGLAVCRTGHGWSVSMRFWLLTEKRGLPRSCGSLSI